MAHGYINFEVATTREKPSYIPQEGMGAADGESANLALDGDRGSEYVCLLVPRDAFDAPCKLRIDPRLNGEVDPPDRALPPAVSLCSSLPCVMFLNQLALLGRIPVPAIAVSESSFTQPNSAVSQCLNSQVRSPLYSNLGAKYH